MFADATGAELSGRAAPLADALAERIRRLRALDGDQAVALVS